MNTQYAKNTESLLMNIPEDIVGLVTVNSTAPFPEVKTVGNVRAWLEANRDSVYWLSAGLLEDLIEEACLANGTVVSAGSGRLN